MFVALTFSKIMTLSTTIYRQPRRDSSIVKLLQEIYKKIKQLFFDETKLVCEYKYTIFSSYFSNFILS